MSRVAVITGATSGLGASYAKYFASMGYDLIITGRRKDVIDKYADKLKNKYRINVDVVIAELSNREGVDQVIGKIKEKGIFVLVNNAGFGMKPYFYEAVSIIICNNSPKSFLNLSAKFLSCQIIHLMIHMY
ncbi:SDR family NAD(P)-dependent oxidoreductase [Clostridium sp. JN-1]|uniref:SDR family NAD(P)-dependent oxidoreductase n=1 Tax=Clostridium sp. JN-1 TaxID=2483110 RepID=UPI00168071C6|nr:SDR family NAD(P)-dependent oxidoreductase [Clostridium sp. JN-1]